MIGGSPVGAADDYFTPREAPWFRARLALRVAVPLDREARAAASKVAWSAALVAPPVTIALVAPATALTLGTVLGLCCAALPGAAATAWAAALLRGTRQLAARALRQAGAEQRIAWLIGAGRLALFAGTGAFGSAVCLAALHAPLMAVLPGRSPLRALLAGDAFNWIVAVALTAALVVGGALAASSPFWVRVDWSRFDVVRYGRSAFDRLRAKVPGVTVSGVRVLGARALRGVRRPR